jgi:hypothetical protein
VKIQIINNSLNGESVVVMISKAKWNKKAGHIRLKKAKKKEHKTSQCKLNLNKETRQGSEEGSRI